jgi:hypothetical protein
MKINFLRFLVVTLLALFVFEGVTLAAQTTSNGNSSASGNAVVTPNDPEQSTTLPQRITQRKNTIKTKVSNAQLQTIAKKCAIAQTGLQDIKTKDKSKIEDRRQAYTDLASKLSTIIGHLERQNIDVTNLKSEQVKFNSNINQYLTDAETYKTALDDAVVMDCAADPAGFEATLVGARQLRSQLSNDSAQVKSEAAVLSKTLTDTKSTLIKSSAAVNNGASQ